MGLVMHKNNQAGLDHGILNVPLSKRGNIDAEIDRHKKQQAAEKADQAACRRMDFASDKARAKEMWARVDFDKIKAEAKRRGVKYSHLKQLIDGLVKWQPHKALIVLPPFLK